MMRVRLLLVIALVAVVAGCAPNAAPVYTRGGDAYYVVRKGDTLYSISWRHGLDHRTVARWNRIDPPYVIHPGQRLRLAAPAGEVVVSAPRNDPPQQRPEPPTTRLAVDAGAISWQLPTQGRLTRRFAADASGKQGIELSGTLGQPVVAAAAGRVVYAGSGLRGYGNLVIVKHNARFLTAYGYNREVLVKEGDAVAAGQQIATMGTGPAQAPALHFELRRDGKPVDPTAYVTVK